MGLKRASYTDEDGRKKVVLLPEDSENVEASMGIPIGPPVLTSLNLPLEIEVRLNNELYHRNILSAQDALKRRPEIMYAIQAALKVDVDTVLATYLGDGYQNARQAKTEIKDAELPKANVNRPPRRTNNRRRPARA